MVTSRRNFPYRTVSLPTDKGDIFVLHRFFVQCWQINQCGGIARNSNIPFQLGQVLLPVAYHFSVQGIVRSIYIAQLLYREVRFKYNLFVSGLCRVESGQIAEIPSQQVAENHYVVTAVHPAVSRIAVPQFPDGRSTFLYHVTIAWISLVTS